MTKNLVIVESPTKAKTLGKILGRGYKVVATGGHLRDLPKSKMGVDIENNFTPQYINVRGKAPVINSLKKEAKAADRVLLATDPDREGEAISWHLSHLLDLDPTDKNRVEFHEITKDAVKNAVENPRAIDMNLVDAQQARRVMDRIVGYKISPLLWKKIKSGLSAGRVQSVALKLICDREQEIREFKPREYWSLKAVHLDGKKTFESEFYAVMAGGKEKKTVLPDEKKTDEIIATIDRDVFRVTSVKKTKKRRNPYAPYTTSTLQQDASRRLGFSTGRTMSVAQQLYEGVTLGNEGSVGLISYMRTDSTRLSPVIVEETLKYIREHYGAEYASKGNLYAKVKKGAQDAHEGIRPSSVLRTPEAVYGYLSADQNKIYRMIWERVVASQMKPSVTESTAVQLNSNDNLFKLNGSIVVFDGFTKVWKTTDSTVILPPLEEGQVLKAKELLKEQHFTKPKARYTEASLVKALEEAGIGRPSTYATTIGSVLKRRYAELENKQFVPTELGETTNSMVVEYFPDIVNEAFTARMEEELDEIADEEKEWKDVLAGFYGDFKKDLEKAESDDRVYQIKEEILEERCPECGKNLVVKDSRHGKFVGCTGYPACKFSKPLVKKVGVDCPQCGGDLVERISKRGKLFFGCSNYPKCEFALWNRPTGNLCPKCESLLVHEKTRRKNVVKCANDQCDYEVPAEETEAR